MKYFIVRSDTLGRSAAKTAGNYLYKMISDEMRYLESSILNAIISHLAPEGEEDAIKEAELNIKKPELAQSIRRTVYSNLYFDVNNLADDVYADIAEKYSQTTFKDRDVIRLVLKRWKRLVRLHEQKFKKTFLSSGWLSAVSLWYLSDGVETATFLHEIISPIESLFDFLAEDVYELNKSIMDKEITAELLESI